MAASDQVVLVHVAKSGEWALQQGRETFYDDERYLRTWEDIEDAIKWSEENLGITPVEPNARRFRGF